MVSRQPGLAMRRHRKVLVVLAVSIALALSGLGIESASASSRSRLAVSLNADRSSATRLDGSTVKGKIYVFISDSKRLTKVDFYLDSAWRTSGHRWQLISRHLLISQGRLPTARHARI